jgi:metal-sulfur cluster biosynthetic enzyme
MILRFPYRGTRIGLNARSKIAGSEARTVDIKMTVTAPGCGMGEILTEDVKDKIHLLPTVETVNVSSYLTHRGTKYDVKGGA